VPWGPLAGLFTFAIAVCEEAKEDSPRAAAIAAEAKPTAAEAKPTAAEFRPQADLNRPKTRPLVRPPLEIAEARLPRIREGGRTSGAALGRLRSACGRNSAASAAAGGDWILFRSQTAVASVNRPASGSRIGDALSYSSQRRRTARKPQPIILLFFIHSLPPNQSRAPVKRARSGEIDRDWAGHKILFP